MMCVLINQGNKDREFLLSFGEIFFLEPQNNISPFSTIQKNNF